MLSEPQLQNAAVHLNILKIFCDRLFAQSKDCDNNNTDFLFLNHGHKT